MNNQKHIDELQAEIDRLTGEDAACGCKCGGECCGEKETWYERAAKENEAKWSKTIFDMIKPYVPEPKSDGVVRLQVKLCFDGMEFDGFEDFEEYLEHENLLEKCMFKKYSDDVRELGEELDKKIISDLLAADLTKDEHIAYLHGVIDGMERMMETWRDE